MSSQDGRGWSAKRVFTTTEAAIICNVSSATIIRCFDRGELRGFRVPGSRFRRIPREDLIEFMRVRGIPTAMLAASEHRIVVVPGDGSVASMLIDALRGDARFEVGAADNEYDVGKLVVRLRPQLVLLDESGGAEIATIRLRLESDPELAQIVVVAASDVSSAGSVWSVVQRLEQLLSRSLP